MVVVVYHTRVFIIIIIIMIMIMITVSGENPGAEYPGRSAAQLNGRHLVRLALEIHPVFAASRHALHGSTHQRKVQYTRPPPRHKTLPLLLSPSSSSLHRALVSDGKRERDLSYVLFICFWCKSRLVIIIVSLLAHASLARSYSLLFFLSFFYDNDNDNDNAYRKDTNSLQNVGTAASKLLYTLHWTLLDAAEECSDADREAGIVPREPFPYIFPLTCIQVGLSSSSPPFSFIYLFLQAAAAAAVAAAAVQIMQQLCLLVDSIQRRLLYYLLLPHTFARGINSVQCVVSCFMLGAR